jgi:putative hydrolase
VEINSRPERRDPPSRLLRLAIDMGCLFTIDSDAHAPGQLDWLGYGCTRAEGMGIHPDRILNSLTAGGFLGRTRQPRGA